jgi:hypothetical protein
MAVKCSAIARSGSRCSAPVLPGSTFCFLHAPEMAEARREAGRKGGKARSAQTRAAKQIPDAMSAADLAGWLSRLFTDGSAARSSRRSGPPRPPSPGRSSTPTPSRPNHS